MATLLDLTLIRPGYFYTTRFEDIITYTLGYLELYNHSILFVVHGSSIFTHDGEQREIHMSPSGPILLDPNMPDIVNTIELCYDDIHDPEGWSGLDGSGWSIVPGTMTYWFKIIDFQPNNKPRDNDKNRRDPPDFGDEDDVDDPGDPQPAGPDIVVDKYDTLLIAIANYHVPNTQRLSQVRFYPKLVKWLKDNNFYPDTYIADKITPGNIANWHEQTSRFNIRIFSEFGNVIYCRKYDNLDDFIDILWIYRKFKYISNLYGMLAERKERVFCNLCKRFHGNIMSCKEIIKPAKTPTVEVPVFPEGRHALVAYADFESVVSQDNRHKCSGYSFICIDRDGTKIQDIYENVLLSPDITTNFIDNLFQAAEDYAWQEVSYSVGTDVIAIATGVILSTAIKHVAKRFRKTTLCKLCDMEIELEDGHVIARNFINGLHGAHHLECWEDPKNAMVCYFHNFRGYDSHYVLQELMKDSKYTCEFIRGKTFEKFDVISATAVHGRVRYRVTFKDTFNYLATSIAKLVKQVETWQYTPIQDRDNKGTFPYKWFDNIDKLRDTQLPSQEHWYNDITQTNVDPQPAIDIWNRENFQNFSEFHDYYMHTDVYQIADIFEEFRLSCVSSFDLDPVYFQGAPGYTWQLNLKIAADKMCLIPDIDVYQDIQANIRGGIAQVMHRYIDISDKPNESILYLDVNSLYSKCMTYKLPTTYIRTIKQLPTDWMNLYTGEKNITAILCVDLAYPDYLHDLHKAYPLAPHKYNGRLCTTFLDKENYLCHAETLKFYLDQGLILVKFHYAYLFNQDYILRDYVESNIIKRRTTPSAPLQTLYKLLNNSLYGKTCENKFKYRKFSIHKEDTGFMGKINSFLIDATNWLPIEDKILVEHKINQITLDKPIQIGFAVLELAKLEMYRFLFNIQDIFKDDVTPLYTDTDSIMLHFKHPSPENILYNDPRTRFLLDFDKVPDHWTIHTPGTHKQSGLWSLETTEKIIEFIGIRAKTYCYKTDSKTILKNKGITATAVELHTREKLTMEHYRQALFHNKEIKVHQVTIGSKKHQLLTKKMIKLAITNNDEKRQVLADKITTIPFGYKGEKFKEYINQDPDLL